MATAPPVFLDPSQVQLTMPNTLFPPPPPPLPPLPPRASASSKSHVLDILKILVGLVIALMLGAILAVLLLVPRTSSGVDLRESNEKIAKLLRDSNENIARLQREQLFLMENERQKRQEDLFEKHREENQFIEHQRFQMQLSIENQRQERQYNITEQHRFEDRLIEQQHEENFILSFEQSRRKLEIEEKRLQILLEEKQLAEQRRQEELSKENADLLSNFQQEVISAKQPLDVTSLELKVHSLIRRFDSFHKSLLIKFLYKYQFLSVKNSNNTTLNLQGANLKDLDLDDMNVEFGEIGPALDYSKLSLPSTNLINASLEHIYLNEANFSWSNMTGASFRLSRIAQTDFNRAVLSLSNFQDANVVQSDFSYTKIERASFRNANLFESLMNHANLGSTNFQDTIAIKTNFSHSEISLATFQSANLFQAQMVAVSARSTNFHTVKAIQANFSYAYLSDCIFQWADLRNASFRTAFLAGANFENANLENVDFTGAFLSGANITAGQLDVVLSISQAYLPNGSRGKNKNLVNNGDPKCTGTNGAIDNWHNNGDVFIDQDNPSTDCVFQARKPNATLQQNIDIRRYERMIAHEKSKIYLEMKDKTIGVANSAVPSAYINVRFLDANNNQIGSETSTSDIAWLMASSTFTTSVPCPSNTVELQITVVFRAANAMINNIYVTIE